MADESLVENEADTSSGLRASYYDIRKYSLLDSLY